MEDFRVETSCASPERGQFQGLLSLASFRILRGPFVGGNLTLTRAALVFFAPLRDIKFSFLCGSLACVGHFHTCPWNKTGTEKRAWAR